VNLVASMKQCSRCGQRKDVDSFARASRSKDGRQGWCKDCAAEHQRANREGSNRRLREWRARNPGDSSRHLRKVRWSAIEHYSGGSPACSCCGEAHPEFLVLDHVNGGGNEERRRYGRGLFGYLKRAGYPDGYRVLCANCNTAFAYYGACPHAQQVRIAS
jgi:hypothetical protein